MNREEEINLLEYWRVIVKRSKLLASITAVITLGVLVYSLFLPNRYRAAATLTPLGGQQQGGGALAVAMSYSGLGGLFSGVGGGSGQLQAILKSRTLAERVIERRGLLKYFRPKETASDIASDIGGAVRALRKNLSFSEDVKLQIITIAAEHGDPKVAQEIIEAYLEELAAYLDENTVTAAKRNRIFIENQLERNKADVLELGKELASFYSPHRLSNVIPRMDVDISLVGVVDGVVDVREPSEKEKEGEGQAPYPLGKGLPGFPEAFADVQKKVDELQKKAAAVKTEIQKTRVVKDVPPDAYLHYLTIRRELLDYMNTFLSQQYELAKIEEAKEDLKFRVVDPPIFPRGKSAPLRLRMFVMGLVVSLFIAVFCVFFREYVEKMQGRAS